MNEDSHRIAVSASDVEQDIGYATFSTNVTPSFDTPVSIRVISYRTRITDPDGISVKAVLDGLVHAGILADDSAKQIKEVTFENRKVKAKEPEKTIIEIEGET